jgi:SAM-dependent methyltransferase
MSQQHDYVLGTDEEELERLGLQHRVWRPEVLKAWSEAGITLGSRVVDLGCGPGYATVDLAEIVGPHGAVLGIERSQRFLNFARTECQRRGFQNVELMEADLTGEIEFSLPFDAVWCRWVACFMADLGPLLRHISDALRPGGTALFHEYADYSTWRSIPESPRLLSFVFEVMKNWRGSGGEPDIVFALLPRLKAAGFEIVETKPIIFAVNPGNFMWQWPRSFVRSHVKRLVESNYVSEVWAKEVVEEFDRLGDSPDSVMLTPMVLQIVARKV